MDRVIHADAPFLAREDIRHLTETLGAAQGQVRFVGGIVRDTLLGIDAADVDLATSHQPEDVIHALQRAGIKVVPTGLAHGTVTAVLPSGPVEVTTLRRDVSTDGRHAIVAFTDDWREDAARRDFTINALYADPLTGEVIDYFGGLDDLAAARVRFIGDPLQRIAEDHLRILRFFRFHARFGDTPDAAGLAACIDRANDLMALSRERIAAELLKLLLAQHEVRVVTLMVDNAVLAPVLPEIDAAGVARLVRLAAREAASGTPADSIRRLAALLPADTAIAENVGARLRLSKLDRRRLISGASPVGGESPQAIGYRLGIDLAADRLLLSDRPLEQLDQLSGWAPPTLPIAGGQLVARGLDKGPDVARMLKAIEETWIAEGFPDAARVAALADQAAAQWLAERKE
ncbi:CCA tRNA nucleotidyltransferase [Sphingomonas hylomeconis]|uniref:CCA tRNA nucleotidyltransferase n=1 Tax=Sphingomonas hylomeconis TaxID=1395958 RepID=A0ABV7SW48_9SPHN|nr:CCA tRNA nucleotidyltransferase [Sphingomonas hylomeconis]